MKYLLLSLLGVVLVIACDRDRTESDLSAGAGAFDGTSTSTPLTTNDPGAQLKPVASQIDALAKTDASPELLEAGKQLTDVQSKFAALLRARQSSSAPNAMAAFYRTLDGLTPLAKRLRARYPAIADALLLLAGRVPVFQYVDLRTGARAYSSPRSVTEAVSHVSTMARNRFQLEGVAFWVLRVATAECQVELFQFSYTEPGAGFVYAYLTRDPNGERAVGEPQSARVAWGSFGYVCENDPGDGAARLHRLQARNKQVQGNPYVGVVTTDERAVANLVRQRWTDQTEAAKLGWAY